jgi:hypothetical protein
MRKGKPDIAPGSSEKEDHFNVKPFIGTLRVTNPVRQSRASPPQAEKRVLRGERRLSLRSVDSKIKGFQGFHTPILSSRSHASIHSRIARSAQYHGLWSFRSRRRRAPDARQKVGVCHPLPGWSVTRPQG